MDLKPDITLAHYRLVEEVGKGGMGVVWRAVDTTLDRQVAIKVLPPDFAADPERAARFEREAKLLASLNHPNIAAVHGLHQEGGVRFIAMEWIPGEDLAQRLARGPLPLEAALTTAREIAIGLEAAHAAGVIHRDLKPANVRVTPEGKIKVLDFGLAKSGIVATSGDHPHESPTLTSTGTRAGVILGTAAYMAPEQAKGLPADRRADVWAFGVLLYELLTGTVAFRGDSVADTLASVLKLEPDLDGLPGNTPPAIRRLIERCLRKDPDRRIHDVADARLEIEDVDLDAPVPPLGGGETAAPPPRRAWTAMAVAAAAGLIVGALLGANWLGGGGSAAVAEAAPEPVRRLTVPLPPDTTLGYGTALALSPDGSTLVFVGRDDDGTRLYQRRFDRFDARPMPGTENGDNPFFSPDGGRVGFFAGGELRTIDLVSGGRDVRSLCEAPVATAATWDENGWIWFVYGESRLARVREDGGEREELGAVGDIGHVEALPGGRGLLVTLQGEVATSIRKDTATLAVLLPDGATVKPVVEGGYNARYVPSGHLVFVRSGDLYAVPFDLERLEATPPAVAVVDGVWTDSIWGPARYDVADDGTLVYVRGGDYARTVPTWIDLASGDHEPLPIPADVYNTFDLSPDGRKLAIQVGSGAQDQIHVYDADRGTFTRLTVEGRNSYPAWGPDSTTVYYASWREDQAWIYRKPVDGTAPEERVLDADQVARFETPLRWPISVTPDGSALLIMTWSHPTRGGDVWRVPLDPPGDPELLLGGAWNEIIPVISPSGEHLAHLSDRVGDYQILVRPYPDVTRRNWQISDDSGFDARWSPRGDAVLYRSGWNGLMRVPVRTGPEFVPGAPEKVLETDFHDSAGSSFAVSPDGRRILVNKPVDMSLSDAMPITLVSGWGVELGGEE